MRYAKPLTSSSLPSIVKSINIPVLAASCVDEAASSVGIRITGPNLRPAILADYRERGGEVKISDTCVEINSPKLIPSYIIEFDSLSLRTASQ